MLSEDVPLASWFWQLSRDCTDVATVRSLICNPVRLLHASNWLPASCRCHEDMSLKLLDLAVEEACKGLPEEHFLNREENIDAAKNMILGVTDGVDPEKTWLYTIVCNRQSGALLAVLFIHCHANPYQHSKLPRWRRG